MLRKGVEEGKPTPSWLAGRLKMDLGQVSREINELEREGGIRCEKGGGLGTASSRMRV